MEGEDQIKDEELTNSNESKFNFVLYMVGVAVVILIFIIISCGKSRYNKSNKSENKRIKK